MNSCYLIPISIDVGNHLALCAKWLLRLRQRGMTVVDDVLGKLTPLCLFQVVIVVEDSAHFLRINSMYHIA